MNCLAARKGALNRSDFSARLAEEGGGVIHRAVVIPLCSSTAAVSRAVLLGVGARAGGVFYGWTRIIFIIDYDGEPSHGKAKCVFVGHWACNSSDLI